MGTKTFTNINQLQKMIEPLIAKAIHNAAEILTDRLHYYIWDSYYSTYDPISYTRSYQFLESATNRMLSSNSAEIYMDADAMSYGNYWDGETQLYMADAGFHGNVNIFRKGFFWKDYIKWCDENAVSILRTELAKVGIKTTK